MILREMYRSIASGEFSKTCNNNGIDLGASFIEIKNEYTSDVLFAREGRLIKNVDSCLMKQIEDLVFSFYLNNQENLLFCDKFCITVTGKDGHVDVFC